ncbi:MAG: hypothetical protein EA363_02215 [Balneolaceae bacterium]|nr:MAG: hypothetical protein EA363_02215 [Balneolaceae bacterium]
MFEFAGLALFYFSPLSLEVVICNISDVNFTIISITINKGDHLSDQNFNQIFLLGIRGILPYLKKSGMQKAQKK